MLVKEALQIKKASADMVMTQLVGKVWPNFKYHLQFHENIPDTTKHFISELAAEDQIKASISA